MSRAAECATMFLQHVVAYAICQLPCITYCFNMDAASHDTPFTTALHQAAERDDLSAAKAALAHIDVNARRRLNESALHVAAVYNSPRVAELLISAGAAIEAQDIVRHTPLVEAALASSHDVIRILLKHGASIEAADQRGFTVQEICSRRQDHRGYMLIDEHKSNDRTTDRRR